MFSSFFFFTDPAKLVAGGDTPFGPGGTVGGKDVFRVTHWHNTIEAHAPAVAACDGTVCAQWDNSNATITLILKPSQTPPFEAPVVSYFLYKGIDPASLLAAGSQNQDVLDENDANANDLTKKIARALANADPPQSLSGSFGALGLSRDKDFLHTDGTTTVFADDAPLERLFTYPFAGGALTPVAAGDKIGAFASGCGFEIVLKRLGYKPKLSFARAVTNTVSVAALPAQNGSQAWQPDDVDAFKHWHEKEQVLAFMDPCAYFGAFVQAKLYKRSGDAKSKIGNLYQDVLKAFTNRNIAWLDIRNNYGYSYNLFGLYGEALRFAAPQDASQTADVNFRTGGWPLLKLTVADVPGSRKGSLHRTMMCLPAGLCAGPAILISKGFVKRLGPARPEERTPNLASDPANAGYLTPVRFAFPATTDGGNTAFTACYTRINIYETIHADPQVQAPAYIAAREFLDCTFRPRELRLDQDFAGNTLRFEVYPEEILVDMGPEFGPTYAAFVGVAEDANTVTFVAYPAFVLPGLDPSAAAAALPAWADMASPDSTNFLTKLAATFPPVQVAKQTIESDTLSAPVDTVLVRNRPAEASNPVTDRNAMEDYCFLVMSKANDQHLANQIAAATALDSTLPAFLTVAGSQRKTDATSHVDYVEKQLQMTGYADGSSGLSVVSAPLTQKVFRNADFR